MTGLPLWSQLGNYIKPKTSGSYILVQNTISRPWQDRMLEVESDKKDTIEQRSAEKEETED